MQPAYDEPIAWEPERLRRSPLSLLVAGLLPDDIHVDSFGGALIASPPMARWVGEDGYRRGLTGRAAPRQRVTRSSRSPG